MMLKNTTLQLIRFIFIIVPLTNCSHFDRETTSSMESIKTKTVFLEQEVSRLAEKTNVLETKLTFLQEKWKRQQEAQAIFQKMEMESEQNKPISSAAPERLKQKRQNHLPEMTKTPIQNAEVSFKDALKKFQLGEFDSAAMEFYEFTKNYNGHPLTAHAYYWAGESHMRLKQYQVAIQRFEAIQNRYPYSIYLPEAIAGLAQANSARGKTNKSEEYKDMLYKFFPDAPATLNLLTSENSTPIGGSLE